MLNLSAVPCLASGLREVGLETAAALAGLALRRGAAERECLLSRTVEPPEGRVPPDARVGRVQKAGRFVLRWKDGQEVARQRSGGARQVNGLKHYGFLDSRRGGEIVWGLTREFEYYR